MTVTVPPYTDLLWPALQAVIAVGYAGLKVQGSYGKSWLIESNYIPSGYVAVVALGGPGSPDNPVAVREHPNAQYRGLRAIPGKGPYPPQESFAARGIGVGYRRRSSSPERSGGNPGHHGQHLYRRARRGIDAEPVHAAKC